MSLGKQGCLFMVAFLVVVAAFPLSHSGGPTHTHTHTCMHVCEDTRIRIHTTELLPLVLCDDAIAADTNLEGPRFAGARLSAL